MLVVLADASIALILNLLTPLPTDRVPVSVVLLLMTAVSWASGKLVSAPAPPLVVAHELEPPQVVFVPTRKTVFAAGKVMPLLPPQSPARVGEAGLAAPARVMSRKSQSVADRAPTVSVRGVPMALDAMNTRRRTVAPAHVKVPVTTWLALKA